MSSLKDILEEMDLEDLRFAMEQQNDGLTKDIINSMSAQQNVIEELHSRVNELEQNESKALDIINRLIAKIEILNTIVGKMYDNQNDVNNETENDIEKEVK